MLKISDDRKILGTAKDYKSITNTSLTLKLQGEILIYKSFCIIFFSFFSFLYSNGQPERSNSEVLMSYKNHTHNQIQWYMSIAPSTQETGAGKLLALRTLRPAWATQHKRRGGREEKRGEGRGGGRGGERDREKNNKILKNIKFLYI